jgi:putative ABC transport system substrate-binding protein
MKKIFFLIMFGGLLSLFFLNKKVETEKILTIAIVQGASHPALDAANLSFQKTLKELAGEKKLNFLFYNAEGSPTQAYAIAQQIQANKQIDLFYGIDSSTAQALSQVEKNRPIVFIGVEDPKERGFLKEFTNMCGVTDALPAESYLEIVEKVIGKNKKVALLYKNETSRKAVAKNIREILEFHGHTVFDFTPVGEIELLSQLDAIPFDIDVILSPADSMIAANINLIGEFQKKRKKPFLACMKNSAKFGALASRGTDYEYNGLQAARMAYEIIFNYKKPYDIPLEIGGYEEIFVNRSIMNILNISLADEKDFIIIEE